jgi:hypothetical protein
MDGHARRGSFGYASSVRSIVVFATATSLTSCATQDAETASVTQALHCEAFEGQSPTHWARPDDSVALMSLLEGAGLLKPSMSDWVDVAAGNACGGQEAELVLVKNQPNQFSVLRGPTPALIDTSISSINSNSSHPWRAVALGDLSPSPNPQTNFDHIVAIRSISSNGAHDLLVAKANPTTCQPSLVNSARIGTASNSDWRSVAIGDFDGGAQSRHKRSSE